MKKTEDVSYHHRRNKASAHFLSITGREARQLMADEICLNNVFAKAESLSVCFV